jgi:hypothetical protein
MGVWCKGKAILLATRELLAAHLFLAISLKEVGEDFRNPLPLRFSMMGMTLMRIMSMPHTTTHKKPVNWYRNKESYNKGKYCYPKA